MNTVDLRARKQHLSRTDGRGTVGEGRKGRWVGGWVGKWQGNNIKNRREARGGGTNRRNRSNKKTRRKTKLIRVQMSEEA